MAPRETAGPGRQGKDAGEGNAGAAVEGEGFEVDAAQQATVDAQGTAVERRDGHSAQQVDQPAGLAADFGRKALTTSSRVSMKGPPMRSMQ